MKHSDLLKQKIDLLILGLKKETAIELLTQLITQKNFNIPEGENPKIHQINKSLFDIISSDLANYNAAKVSQNLEKNKTDENNFEDENEFKNNITTYINQKFSELSQLADNSYIRPNYSSVWQKFLKEYGILEDEKTLKAIDALRIQQIKEEKSANWFYSEVYFKVLNEFLKTEFSRTLPLTWKWINYIESPKLSKGSAKFTDAQLAKIDKIIKRVEDNNEPPINSFREILFDPELLASNNFDAVPLQLALFSETFPDVFKWLNFERDVQNIAQFSQEQWNIIHKLSRDLYTGTINQAAFINSIYRHRSLLDYNQKAYLLATYPQVKQDIDPVLGWRQIANSLRGDGEKVHNTRSPAKKNSEKTAEDKGQLDDEEFNDSLSKNKKRKSPNKLEKEKALVRKKHKQKPQEQLSKNFSQEEIDNAINTAVNDYSLKCPVSGNATAMVQKTEKINKIKYLRFIIKIVPPAHLDDSNKEKFGQEVVVRLQSLIPNKPSWENIILVTEDGSWKEKNMYMKQNDKAHALTLPENSIIGTVAIRAGTAANFAQKRKQTAPNNSFNVASPAKISSTPSLGLLSSNLSKTFQSDNNSMTDTTKTLEQEAAETMSHFFNIPDKNTSPKDTTSTTTTSQPIDVDGNEDVIDSIFEMTATNQQANKTSKRETLIKKIEQVRAEIARLEMEYAKTDSRFKR